MQTISQPLPLDGTRNTRELGGYRTEGGLVLKKRGLLRSDALNRLTEADRSFLYRYGVRCVIDLRSRDEIDRFPDRLPGGETPVEAIHIPLQDPTRKRYASEAFPPSMWELYCWMLDDSKAEVRAVFGAIAGCDGCVLFHCTGGKDRTGTIAMLLLKLCGVDDETVVGDYALTESVMQELFSFQTKDMESRGFSVPPYIMQSPPENMKKLLAYLSEAYGTARDYLLQAGVPERDLERVRAKLVS